MLAHLHIKDLGIIDEIDIELENGMNVLTGETGAGKSLVLSAVQLVLGGKASKDVIRKGATKASVEALFLIGDSYLKNELEKLNIEIENDLVITREISERSLIKVNGALVSVNELKEIGRLLIDIHGQHDSQSLLNAKTHIRLLDDIALSGNHLIKEYKELYNERSEYISKLNKIGGTAQNRERQLEFLKFQLDELENANIKPKEDSELEEKIELLNGSKNIIYSLESSYEKLNYILPTMQKITSELSGISKYNEKYNNFIEIIQNSFYELDEVTRDIKNSAEAVEVNPEELNKLEERLDLIIKLKRKYGSTIEDVLNTFSKLSSEYDELINSEQIVNDLENKIKITEEKMYKISLEISNIRKEKAKIIETEVESILSDLEMPKTTFNIKIEFDENKEFKENGLDKVEFLFASNYGEELKPLSKVASGGEMSRIMLAIKTVLSDADKIPTMIFDEIDTGISGKAGFAVADKLHNLAKYKQIICVTHLASIAAKGNNNLYVDKGIQNDRTVTKITKLNEEEVLNEIARIISGGNITETAVLHAKEIRKKW